MSSRQELSQEILILAFGNLFQRENLDTATHVNRAQLFSDFIQQQLSLDFFTAERREK